VRDNVYPIKPVVPLILIPAPEGEARKRTSRGWILEVMTEKVAGV
jgi:hypothetical protein